MLQGNERENVSYGGKSTFSAWHLVLFTPDGLLRKQS